MGALRSEVANLVEMPDRRAYDVQQAVRRTALGNASAKSVLQVLAAAVDAKGWCFVSTENVLAESDVDLRTLQKIKQVFAAMGLLTHVRLSRAEMAELRQRGGVGAYREEEWQLALGMLGSDLSAEYARLLAKVNGKAEKPAARVKAKPGPSSAAAADAADSSQHAAAALSCAAAAHPFESLLGKNSIEHQGTPTHARSGASGGLAKALDGASAQAVAEMGVLPLNRPAVLPFVWQALEAYCEATGATPAQAAATMAANWRAAKAAGRFMAVNRWVGEGHCWHVPVVSRGDQAERRRQADAAVGVWRPEEPVAKLPLEVVNECRVKGGMRPVSAEDYARW